MAQVDVVYHELLKDILENGIIKEDRTGVGTISVFGRQLRFNLKNNIIPLITTKKMFTKGVIYELFWFLGYHMNISKYKEFGLTNLKWLVDNDVNIWVGDAYKNYVNKCSINDSTVNYWMKLLSENDPIAPNTYTLYKQEEFIEQIKTDDRFAKKWGELGPIYGKQWIQWKVSDKRWLNQIQWLISELKKNPDSRRLMVNAWNVSELNEMILPPCHYGFQCYTRKLTREERINWILINCFETGMEKGIAMTWTDDIINSDRFQCPTRALYLKYNIRSNDIPLGAPYNILSYAIFAHILAKECNMVAEELICSIGDAHLYLNQIDAIKEQLERDPNKYSESYVQINDKKFEDLSPEDIKIINYISYPTIKIPLSN